MTTWGLMIDIREEALLSGLHAPHPNPERDELERLGDQIAELSAHPEVANARLLDLIREFDARGGWADQGARSCAHWLAWRLGLDLGAARERVRVARALGTLPRLSQAHARGEVSYAKARALTRVATPETEERLLEFSKRGTAAQVERLVRGWRRMDRNAENEETRQRQRSRSLYVHQDEDGMFVVQGRLTPEVGAVLKQALAAAAEAMYQKARVNDLEGDPPTIGQQQADAIGMIAEAALHHGIDPGAAGERYQVVVHVDAAPLADPDQPGQSVLEEGEHVSAETSRRLACDASRVVMRHDPDGGVVEVGARTRTIPPSLRRALQHRDRGCRFPGCGLPFTQGHHIRHWANGGPTTLSNLTLLCRRHHRSVHEDGFRVERLPDGELQFWRPNGWPLPDAPPLPPVPDDVIGRLRAENEAAGLHLDGRAARGTSGDTSFSPAAAIDGMHPRVVGY